MPDTKICKTCKGQGYYEALVSQHDDVKVTVKCKTCDGKGTINQMTEEEMLQFIKDGRNLYNELLENADAKSLEDLNKRKKQ